MTTPMLSPRSRAGSVRQWWASTWTPCSLASVTQAAAGDLPGSRAGPCLRPAATCYTHCGSADMFERFTDRARRVVVLAQDEAMRLDHNYIGTEHILLGLVQEGEGVAAKALEALGIGLAAVRQQVEEIVGRGKEAPGDHIPFTPRAKKVLELSLREALQLGYDYIGTEHILLGLIREGEGVAARVLANLGADLNLVRQQVVQLLHGYQGKEPAAAGTPSESAPSTSLVLDQFGRNLTAGAREGKLDPVIGREKEIERVMQVLSRRTKN